MRTCILMICGALLAADGPGEKVLFEDRFEARLADGWSWVREDRNDWRIRQGRLEVRSQPGRIWGGNDAENLLLAGPFEVRGLSARVTVAHEPGERWEQAGPLWYVDDDNFVKLISEFIDGKMYVVIARELEAKGAVVGKIEVPSANIQLRLLVAGDSVTGQWRLNDKDDWSEAGKCDFRSADRPRVGLFTQNGPADQVRWVRFDDFVVAEEPL